ncbi:hypothetical protein [Paenibacillus sp. GCM10027626]|uniref:hypothetical protein n=1 Tax=Paenibacillus sp. GCM10027626 TaxID=3273411 RepID=UPI00362E4BF6
MEASQIAGSIPQWIWHKDLHGAPRIELSRTFVLEKPIAHAELRIALTGAIEVDIDGVAAGQMEESPANLCVFHRVASFLETLATFMPTAPVSNHLYERTVGCVAFLSADDFWLRTDESWKADEEAAAKVCLLGDVEDGPEWFVAGGFDDIATSPISDFAPVSAALADVSQKGATLRVSGVGQGIPRFLANMCRGPGEGI